MNKKKKEYEPHFTVGLVLRCSLVDITKLKQFLDSSDISVTYQTTVGGDKRLEIKEQEVNSK